MKLLPVVVFILSVSLASAQQSSCCSPATEAFASMANDMEQINHPLEILEYDADHAFANPSNPSYNQQAAEEAYAASIAFLRDALQH
jgi:dienelactone hydrolase